MHTIIRTQGTLQQGPFSMFLSSMAQQASSAHNMWSQQMANMFGGMFPFGSQPGAEASKDGPSPGPSSATSSSDDSEAATEGRDTMKELRERLDSLLAAKEALEKKKG